MITEFQKVVKVRVRVCDVCGGECPSNQIMFKCYGCGKEIAGNHKECYKTVGDGNYITCLDPKCMEYVGRLVELEIEWRTEEHEKKKTSLKGNQ